MFDEKEVSFEISFKEEYFDELLGMECDVLVLIV